MITRRDFIWMTALGATAALVNWQAPASAGTRKAGPGDYDAVIIGAGLGGLSCAALLAMNGFRPLVVEKHYVPGGYASSFTRTGQGDSRYPCEVSLHATAATSPSLRRLYGDLGIEGKIEWIRHPHAWSSRYPGFSLDIPHAGLEGFQALLMDRFPRQKTNLTEFFTYWKNLEEEVERYEREGMPALKVLFPLRYPTMWDIRNKTLKEVMDRYISDPQAASLICQTWGYYGLPPARLSAFYYLHPFGEYLRYGGYYAKGTSQAFSNALADVIKGRGGRLILNDRVTEITVADGKATGVRTASGKTFSARAVVSNAAVPETLAMLSKPEAMPATYRNRIAAYTPSLSSFIVWLGLNADVTSMEKRAEINLYTGYDSETAYRASREADPTRTGAACMIYDNLVPGFSPPGKSTVSIMFLSGYEPWRPFEKDYLQGHKGEYRKEKERIADLLIDLAERRVIPGLRRMIDMRETASPLTNRRFTGNTGGAIYGFDQTVDNAFMSRLEVRAPLQGLYLASAWSNPGGGHEGALFGGKNAFKALIEDWG